MSKQLPKIFLSFRVFGLISSSLLWYSQPFGWCILRPSWCVSCRIWKPIQNFEQNPLFNLCGVLDCSNSDNHKRIQVLSYSKYFFNDSKDWTCNVQLISRSSLSKRLYPLRHESCGRILSEFLGLINLMFLSTYEIRLITIKYDFFYLSSYCNFFM